jgi:hypothetical protein
MIKFLMLIAKLVCDGSLATSFANSVRDHSSITSAKRWVGGVRIWQFLLIYSTIYADVGGWVGLKNPKT